MELSKVLREYGMKRFGEQEERSQIILFPERLDDYVNEDNPVRVVDVFVEGLH
jgi:transposase